MVDLQRERDVSQTELSVRMRVLRPYVGRALRGEINITFASAVCFAKALQFNFFQQLVRFIADEFYSRPKAINIFLQLG